MIKVLFSVRNFSSISITNDNKKIYLFLAIFAGQLKSTLECSHCQYQSTTFDVFWDLSIPLPRVREKDLISKEIN